LVKRRNQSTRLVKLIAGVGKGVGRGKWSSAFLSRLQKRKEQNAKAGLEIEDRIHGVLRERAEKKKTLAAGYIGGG